MECSTSKRELTEWNISEKFEIGISKTIHHFMMASVEQFVVQAGNFSRQNKQKKASLSCFPLISVGKNR